MEICIIFLEFNRDNLTILILLQKVRLILATNKKLISFIK
jgi:hypothetical protein